MSKGGAYYLLSRSLGPAIGGSLGILFYFATTISGAMYILGAMEVFIVALGISNEAFFVRFFFFIILLILLGINWFGLNFVSKTGIVFLCVTFASLISILIGLLFASLRK